MSSRDRAHHAPAGDPCGRCGLRPYQHRVYHQPQGEPCKKCGLGESAHRYRGRLPLPPMQGCKRPPKEKKPRAPRAPRPKLAKPKTRTPRALGRYPMGIDGEGAGRAEHRYIFLAAASENRERSAYVEDERGLSTRACLEFILSLPARAALFAYSFNYDLTMMLKDLPDRSLYWLFRPDVRKRRKGGPWPVLWEEFSLNLMGTKFTVKRGNKTRVVWDVFKFYQSKFVSALKDWKAAPPEAIAQMSDMKDNRANFDDLYQRDKVKVWDYCLNECAYLATLAKKLIAAHEDAGLKLKNFYGAGSSGAAMLTAMGVKSEIVPTPEHLKECVASAFFGGRFENSVIGVEEGPIYNYDIASAYPYQLMFLPCLKCGKWAKTKSPARAERAQAALVRYETGSPTRSLKAALTDHWAPLPYRTPNGEICYPKRSAGGWVWGSEFFAAVRLFRNVKFREAWVYETDCGHQPFERIAHYYRERIKLGKEGPGIVLKLGCNSCYGKLAQSIGSAPFNSWIWAGMITAGTRAQLLDGLGCHEDPRNMLMVATDGIFSRERLSLPAPRDTGTDGLLKVDGTPAPPLGSWEETVINKGIFVARPGVYFPLDPSPEELKKVRGRGVGKSVVLSCWRDIVRAYEEQGIGGSFEVTRVVRFCGAKSSISKYGPPEYPMFRRADGKTSAVRYGNWVERTVEMTFNPMPKRSGVMDDGRSLVLREIAGRAESAPYDRAMRSQEERERDGERLSAEAEALKREQEEQSEQPDQDFVEYDVEV